MIRYVRTLVQMALLICAFSGSTMISTKAQSQPASWTQVGMLNCKLNPRIGFVIFGHQSMECRFVQNPPFPPQAYEGALNIVGLDLGSRPAAYSAGRFSRRPPARPQGRSLANTSALPERSVSALALASMF